MSESHTSDRMIKAEQALASYDLGEYYVKRKGTWNTSRRDEWRLPVTIESKDGDEPPINTAFIVKFEGDEVYDHYMGG